MEHIFLKFIKRLESLRLLDDDHFSWSRHRILHRQVSDLRRVDISAEDHGKVEGLLLGCEDLVLEEVAELVDIVGLITHEQIHGCKLSFFELSHQSVE